MGVFLLAFVLVIGFLFTHNNPPSRYRQQRSSGWDSYFHVASWGFVFSLGGLLIVVLFWLVLNILSFIINLPGLVFGWQPTVAYLGTLFIHLKIHDIPFSLMLAFMFGALMAYGVAKQKKEQLENDEDAHAAAYREVALSDGMEELFFDAMQQGLLVLITLKSRKVYIGTVNKPRFIHADTENLMIIPMISGYRDKDDLSFKPKHSYIDYYKTNDVCHDSKPLCIADFRIVIPRSEVESASLFDPDTFLQFDDVDKQGVGIASLMGK